MALHPRHRANCADFFATPKQSSFMALNMPEDLQAELEHEAALAGRTWNDYVGSIVNILLGHQPQTSMMRAVWRTSTPE
jgi:hypothetical protein